MGHKHNISQELFEAIESYYNHTMEEKERIDFEDKLKKDPNFRGLVEDTKTLLLGIENQSLKEKMDEFHKDIPKSTLKHNSPKIGLWQFAKYTVAAIFVIALGSYWYFEKPSNEKMYAKYFTPDPGLATTMSATDNFDFYDAMVNYKHGDYNIAISKWKKIQQKKPTNDTINYFLGVAFLAEKKEQESIPYFQKVFNNSHSIFFNDTHFYLGLAYLKTNNISKAKASFKNSANKKSMEILSELK